MYHKWQSYNVWFLRYGARQTEFFLILEHFMPFYPTNNPKNQNFEKIKAGDIIILQNCTKNHDHMLYCSWEMAHDRCNFYFSFQAIFGSFTSLTAWKIKILKKMKKMPGDNNCIPKIMIRWCTIPEICCAQWKDGWTDRQTEEVTYRAGYPPKNQTIE